MTFDSQRKECSREVLEELRFMKQLLMEFKACSISTNGALERLTDKLGNYIDLQSKSIPLRLVFLLFGLVFALVFGVEALQSVLKLILA